MVRDRGQFIIDRIEYSAKGEKTYISKMAPLIEINGMELCTESGDEYTAKSIGTRNTGLRTTNRFEYSFCFGGKDPNLEPGSVLYKQIPKWVREIPECRIVKVIFEEVGINFSAKQRFKNHKIVIDSAGNVFINKGKTRTWKKKKQIHIKVAEEKVSKLFEDLYECITQPDSKHTTYFDDTRKKLLIKFENGYLFESRIVSLENNEGDYVDTLQIVYKFLKDLDGNILSLHDKEYR